MPQTISLDKETFRALAGDTRIEILKELKERQKTQSELALKLHLSAPTVNEHISLLKKAGLVQEIDDGHKWKYFSLSSKGKSIMSPESEKQIMLVLSLLTISFVGMFLMFLSQLNGLAMAENTIARTVQAPLLSQATGEAAKSTAYETINDNAIATVVAQQANILLQIAILLASALFIGVMAGYLLKRRN